MAGSQISPKKSKFTFYTTREYFDELLVGIRAARKGDRILLMTMTFHPIEPMIATLCRELERAAARGVHLTLAVDAHSFLLSPAGAPGPLLSRRKLPRNMPTYFRKKYGILESINAYPTGHAVILNQPKPGIRLPIAGRSHIKAAIINNNLFIGGCNLQAENQIDMMVGWKSQEDADTLYQMMQKITHGRHVGSVLGQTDRGIAINDHAELLLDSGVRGQSLIFDEALQLIDSAEEWLVITCQFFPNSITARHLAQAAKRGVKIEVVYSHPKHHGLIGGFGQHISILRERTRVPRALFKDALSRKDPMLHAKLIACDKGVMIGSHNYVRAGVILGTAEIAVKMNDENLAREAVKTLHRGLKKPKK